MKTGLLDRLLLGLVLLLFIACMTVVILCCIGVIPASGIIAIAEGLSDGGVRAVFLRVLITVVAAVLAFAAGRLLFTGGKKRGGEQTLNASMLSSDEHGSAYISAASIDSMAQKYVKANKCIRECASKVTVNADSTVSVSLKAVVLADTNIPELCDTVRTELKNYIENYAGVKVDKIAFTVVNTYTPTTAARVN
ncbi:MAG: Asp23/Gls24 family envelope stress response protein [Clostridia bacterium]|nr:Asp23/Gls24 family envelope stress response protein [Clostridia bacterium]